MFKLFNVSHREKNEQTEFDFDTDKYDIRIPAELDQVTGKPGYKKQERQDQVVPESDYSLRVSILLTFFINISQNWFFIT